MPLTEPEVKKATASNKIQRLSDGGGLYLEISPAGGKHWRLKYRMSGKEKRLTIGSYPKVSIKQARAEREKAKLLIQQGIDPSAEKKANKENKNKEEQNTLEHIANEWLREKHKKEVVDDHFTKNQSRLQNHIFPFLGQKPITTIKAPEILETLKRVSDNGSTETAHRLKGLLSQIYRYSIGTGRAERDPTSDLKGLLPSASKQAKHFPAITDPKELPPLLRAIYGYEGLPATRAALIFQSIVFVRPNELRMAKWEDIDFENEQWTFISSKTNTPLIIPLPKQAIELLNDIKEKTNPSPYIFPSPRSPKRPLSDNTLKAALDRMDFGGKHTAHGFRATARTLLDEVLDFPPHIIEQQLAHLVKDANGRAYNRTAHIEQRRIMLQQWANYLDTLRNENNFSTK